MVESKRKSSHYLLKERYKVEFPKVLLAPMYVIDYQIQLKFHVKEDSLGYFA